MGLYDNKLVCQLHKFTGEIKDNPSHHRYLSFDFCYSYFHPDTRTYPVDLEKSCYVIGFYLASWGMLRGSSYLLQQNVSFYEPLVRYIYGLDRAYWDLDVDNYDKPETIKLIFELYGSIKKLLSTSDGKNQPSVTLVTKTMLGIFACVPAFDQYFCNSFRNIFSPVNKFRSVSAKSLNCLNQFYQANKQEIDKFQSGCDVRGINGEPIKLKYSKAKIIDMYGFQKGKDLNSDI